MLSLARLTPFTITRARAALVLTLIAAAACSDRAATAPERAATQRASTNTAPYPFDFWAAPLVVNAGDTAIVTITLATPAPPQGAHVTIRLAHSSAAVLSVPSAVDVSPGDTIKTFIIPTNRTSGDAAVNLVAEWGGLTHTAYFSVRYVPPPPSISVSPGNLTFGSQGVGTSSRAQVVTVHNTSNVTALTFGVIGVNGPFTQTNNCPVTLAPYQYCSISVVYVPTGSGAQSGLLTVPSNTPSSPNVVTLNGTGFIPTPAMNITPASVGFGSLALGLATSGRVVKITSTGTGPLVISSLTLGGTNPDDFALSPDGCAGASLSPGASCTFRVSFEPNRLGTRTATVTIAHNAGGGPAAVSLSGAGVKGGPYIP